MTTDTETIVIGAGVVGLAIAHALSKAGHEVMVLERHGRIGAETSSRNSEVIHAGLYYPKGSLKARLSTEGRNRLYAFAADNGVTARRVGKLLVATDGAEAAKLDGIAATARANGVTELIEISPADARRLEPEVYCTAACLSPSTGIIDSRALMQALEGHITNAGGRVVLNATVTGLSLTGDGCFAAGVESGGSPIRLTSRHLINAAGLAASRIGRMLPARGNYRVPETFFAKGHYFTLASRPPFQKLVYPVPAAGSLGIHFTLDTGGSGRFGPDITWDETPSAAEPVYTFEDADGARLHKFETAIRRYWPALPSGALQPGYTGIRPKIGRANEPAADFAIHGEREHGIPGFVGLYGIESPGLTSCLAIGEYVAAVLGANAS